MINIFYVKLVLIYRTLDLDMGEVQNSFGGMAVSGRNSRSARNGYTRYMYR
jgi:hypothetical protein